ncbi:hypothetical protein BSKO_03841 [Bryopsis sp. KO-2023]|nr:hypothetical protein BSKO_03841 [Bryopsis sp. KO-2023]
MRSAIFRDSERFLSSPCFDRPLLQRAFRQPWATNRCYRRHRSLYAPSSSLTGTAPPHIAPQATMGLEGVTELDDDLAGVIGDDGLMTVAGFGSLLSERSSRYTFPDLLNFRVAKVPDFRRVFAHAAPIFFQRGIARVETGETSSLGVEPCKGAELWVACFEVPATKEAIEAFIEREHEFRFVKVFPEDLAENGFSTGAKSRPAVLCCRNTDEEYKAKRCPPEEFNRRYGQYGIHKVFRDDIFPCRVYLRHCTLAAKNLHPLVFDNFMDRSYLGDRKTTVREYLAKNPSIMEELPPPELEERYCG